MAVSLGGPGHIRVLCAAGWGAVVVQPTQYEVTARVYLDTKNAFETAPAWPSCRFERARGVSKTTVPNVARAP